MHLHAFDYERGLNISKQYDRLLNSHFLVIQVALTPIYREIRVSTSIVSLIKNKHRIKMAFVSNWEGVESVPENYVFPPEKRPGVSAKKMIPVIDFGTPDRALLFQTIFESTQEFGFFQVINHGVSKKIVEDMIRISKEFHAMSPEEKEREFSKDPNKSCKVFTSTLNYVDEPTHCWRDSTVFHCHPLDKYIHFWPENPPKFREVVGAYCTAMRKLTLEILELIGEGLGLERSYFEGGMIENPLFSATQYPPCPNPNLAMGLRQHSDPTLITILSQDASGLQFLKDDEWIVVDPVDDAFLINMGYIFEVISNGKLKAKEHRVVTNTETFRQSLTYLVYPRNDVTIEPAKCLLNNESNPPVYRSMKTIELRTKYALSSMYEDKKKEFIDYISLTNPNVSGQNRNNITLLR